MGDLYDASKLPSEKPPSDKPIDTEPVSMATGPLPNGIRPSDLGRLIRDAVLAEIKVAADGSGSSAAAWERVTKAL